MYIGSDLTLLKARLEIGGTEWDSVLNLAGSWAQEFIDTATDRTFEAAAGTHYFTRRDLDPDNPRRLVFDEDLVAVISLKNADAAQTTIAATDYFLEPRNTSPKESLLLKREGAGGTDGFEFATDGELELAGSWGYSATADAEIKGVALRLAEWHFRSKDLEESTTPYSDATVLARQPGFPSEVLEILDRRRRLR